MAEKQANIASAAMFGIKEATLATVEQEKSEVDLHQLITSEEDDLRVIAMWGTRVDHGKTSAIQEVYDDPKNTVENSITSDSVAMIAINEDRLTDMEEKLKAVHASSSVQTISDLKVTVTAAAAAVTATKKVATMPTSEIQQEDERPNNVGEEEVCNSTAVKKNNRSRTLTLVDGVFTGRETEKSIVIKLVGQPDSNQGCKVISVWGMGGVGKTTLVRSVYRSQELALWKHAWVTALCPFNPEVLLRDITLQLCIQEDFNVAKLARDIARMDIQELKVELARQLNTQKCLVVLDDISSTSEWDLVKGCLDNAGRIIITTRARIIAEHCSGEYKNIYSLEGLNDDAALDLFTKKVMKENTEKVNFVPAMMEQARIILKKCDGLPLAISTIEPHKIRLDRLLRRWIAEGYSQEMHGITAEQLGHRYFDELLDRSMVLPGEDSNPHNGKINSCQLHDIIREICISKAREENLVFTLEDGCCLSSTQGPIRHLVIGRNWKGDGDALMSVLDLSHVRSLTMFGEWRPFFISNNMRFLRVLDLEDTIGLIDHHLDRVGQLHHLKYLSLRGCFDIFCLPDSLGNLRHLQTLDVKGTRIFELPTTITNLVKLQSLRAPDYLNRYVMEEDVVLAMYCLDIHAFCKVLSLLLRPKVLGGGLNRRDVLNRCRFGFKDISYGTKVPRGIGRLKALHTLGGANVTWDEGNATVKELRELTELRKLGVVGISSKNSREFWSAIAGHYHLRSLSVRGEQPEKLSAWSIPMGDDLDGCLGEGLSPPSWLESLKLYGKLVRITDWIDQLQHLCKLVLEFSRFGQDDTIQALGILPNLAVLRLKIGSFLGRQLLLQNSAFPSLVALELDYLSHVKSVVFEEDTMPRLELLQICGRWKHLDKISGLSVLTSLKEIRLDPYVAHILKEQVPSQLEEHPKHVIVNIMHTHEYT
ncbi:unnamed protein product [Alopecurus aequalis]